MKNALYFVLCFLLIPLGLNGQYIYSFAGNGSGTTSGDGGSAVSAGIGSPKGLAFDRHGNLFITCDNRIRKVSASGIITAVAGTGSSGFSGDGGPATAATFRDPRGIVVDTFGNIYISDCNNNRIRKINSSGIISTIAGDGTAAFSGDGGAASAASLFTPSGLALDTMGNLFIADLNNYRIRKVATSGIITTFAGSGSSGGGAANCPATAFGLLYPTCLVIDRAGNLYVSCHNADQVYKINTHDTLTIFAGVCAGCGGGGDGVPATAASIYQPYGITIDNAGNFYIADQALSNVRKVDTAGIISTVTGISHYGGYNGDGIPAITAKVNYPWDLAVNDSGELLIADEYNYRVRIVPINHDPSFINGTAYHRTIFENSLAVPLNSWLTVFDRDTGQSIGWLALNSPAHGTLAGLPDTVRSTGGNVSPVGITYRPAAGYVGIDSFRMRTGDRSASDTMEVYVNVIAGAAPSFTLGASQSLVVCQNASATSISSLLPVSDADTGQAEVWSVNSNPHHGSLTGFNDTLVCTGSVLAPTGLFYTPASGYYGTDSFRVKVFDGVLTDTIVIYVTVNPLPHAGTLSGPSALCVGGTTAWTSTVTGGTWHSVHTSIAAITATSGIISAGSTGVDSITYSVTNSCGTDNATRLLTVTTVPPVPMSIIGPSSVCEGVWITLTDSTTGGGWVSASPTIATVYGAAGVVTGVAAGSAVISYVVTNSCGASAATHTVNVIGPAWSGVISGPASVCLGTGAVLTDGVSGGRWSSDSTSIATIDSLSGVVTSLSAGTAIMHYSVLGSCATGVSDHAIAVNPYPVSGAVSGPDSVCQGASVTLISAVTCNYWISSDAATASIGTTTGIVTGVHGGYVTFYNIVYNVCGADTTSFTMFVISMNPDAGLIDGGHFLCAGDTTSLYNSVASGTWSSGNPSIASVAGTGLVTAIGPGTTMITYTVHNSCGGAGIAFHGFTVYSSATCEAGVSNLNDVDFSLTLAPNPNEGVFQLTGNWGAGSGSSGVIQIIDVQGREVFKSVIENASGSCNESIVLPTELAEGVYSLRVYSGTTSKALNFVIRRTGN